jgi:hypothetical protein
MSEFQFVLVMHLMYAVRVLGICIYVTYVCDTVIMVKFIAGIPFKI